MGPHDVVYLGRCLDSKGQNLYILAIHKTLFSRFYFCTWLAVDRRLLTKDRLIDLAWLNKESIREKPHVCHRLQKAIQRLFFCTRVILVGCMSVLVESPSRLSHKFILMFN